MNVDLPFHLLTSEYLRQYTHLTRNHFFPAKTFSGLVLYSILLRVCISEMLFAKISFCHENECSSSTDTCVCVHERSQHTLYVNSEINENEIIIITFSMDL